MFGPDPIVEQRLQNLERHLKDENPILISAVSGYREIDRVAYRMGLLDKSDSFAMQIPWWPLVSVLGTFSSGKSTFINHFLGQRLQSTGNQAVDDKFTVICHSREGSIHVLPGLSLDADPRFPFYQISEEIEKVSEGEGGRVDAYLQLKTCPGDALRGIILIDSPGFDADEQRTATLRITEHIVNLSDLVLVFFDARHPEPGAMQDTLEHLVANSIGRADANKFLYILNQIDVTAREDNPEEVFGAWQRALASKGLTAGRFYTIYNQDAASPIENESIRQRFESKRDADLSAIEERMGQVNTERAYRIVGNLEKLARSIEEWYLPALNEAIAQWRRRTLVFDAILFGLLTVMALSASISLDYWQGFSFNPPWLGWVVDSQNGSLAIGAVILLILSVLHHQLRRISANRTIRLLARDEGDTLRRDNLIRAFRINTRFWRSLFSKKPVGWGRRTKRRLANAINETDRLVQMLNDRFANPAGVGVAKVPSDAQMSAVQPATNTTPAPAAVSASNTVVAPGGDDLDSRSTDPNQDDTVAEAPTTEDR